MWEWAGMRRPPEVMTWMSGAGRFPASLSVKREDSIDFTANSLEKLVGHIFVILWIMIWFKWLLFLAKLKNGDFGFEKESRLCEMYVEWEIKVEEVRGGLYRQVGERMGLCCHAWCRARLNNETAAKYK